MGTTGIGFAGLSLWLSLVGLGAQPSDAGLKIEVHLYNYCEVCSEILVRAEQEAARVLERTGVDLSTARLLAPFVFGPVLWSAEGVAAGICNVEHLPGKVVARAESTASYVFSLVGIGVVWTPCADPEREASAKPRFILRLMDHSRPIASGAWTPDAFGRAYLMADGTANYAEVYYEPVRQLTAAYQLVEVDDILGYAVAHELGHLLLGPRHATSGIMSVRWNIKDLQMMTQRRLRFTQAEGSAMQRKLGLGTRTQEGRPQCRGAEPAIDRIQVSYFSSQNARSVALAAWNRFHENADSDHVDESRLLVDMNSVLVSSHHPPVLFRRPGSSTST